MRPKSVISMNHSVLKIYVIDVLTYYVICFLVFIACEKCDELIDLQISEGYKSHLTKVKHHAIVSNDLRGKDLCDR